jgi:hypothetical protein
VMCKVIAYISSFVTIHGFCYIGATRIYFYGRHLCFYKISFPVDFDVAREACFLREMHLLSTKF